MFHLWVVTKRVKIQVALVGVVQNNVALKRAVPSRTFSVFNNNKHLGSAGALVLVSV
jgi:hypothetical protein